MAKIAMGFLCFLRMLFMRECGGTARARMSVASASLIASGSRNRQHTFGQHYAERDRAVRV